MNEVDMVEMVHSMTGLAALLRAFNVALRREGFGRRDAHDLTKEWMRITLLGASESEVEESPTEDES